MLTHVPAKTWIRSGIVSFVCIMLFLLINVIFTNAFSPAEESIKLTKEEAKQIAKLYIEEQTGADVEEMDVVYSADKNYTGYIAKYEAVTEHYKNTDAVFPAEKYRVFAILEQPELEVYVDINFISGKVIGWSFPFSEQLTVDEASKALVLETLKQHNFPIDNMELTTSADGTFVAKNSSILNIKDTSIQVEVKTAQFDGKTFVVSYTPEVTIPADYISETSAQDRLANLYTNIGFLGMSVIMAILAIIYAVIYRQFTSFKYGIVFTVIATILSCIAQISMIKPILMLSSNSMQQGGFEIIFTSIIIVFIVLITAVSYYFSFVAGDGLWKAQGFNLWPRFKEKAFGKTVWNSMLIAFLFALSGLGIQAVIFEGLSYIIGTYQAVDSSQSPLNTSILWFYPALAWMAAITEEAVYRYFGVGIFRRWFKNTYVAAIIPSLVWAFGHTLYPLYPVSTRIIELLLIGILLTWVMVKFGLLTVIFTHAFFNSIAMSLTLFSYGESFDIVMGVLYIVVPFVVAFIIKVMHDRYIKNRPEPPAPDHVEQPGPYPPQPPYSSNVYR